jgi:PBP1b-binding outer membrane lipoprotein LpoB
MKKMKFLAMFFAVTMLFASCATHVHTVGKGAQSSQTVQKKQWYALFGLVPINTVDSKEMASGAKDYTIKTEQSFIDGIISAFAGIITINVRTVEVKK